MPYNRNVDWNVVVQEIIEDTKRELAEGKPNRWRILHDEDDRTNPVNKYHRCTRSMAKHAMKNLRDRGLHVDKREHFQEFDNVPDPMGGFKTLREGLRLYSVYAIYYPEES